MDRIREPSITDAAQGGSRARSSTSAVSIGRTVLWIILWIFGFGSFLLIWLALNDLLQARQLAGGCASLSICPQALAVQIAQLTDNAIEILLIASAIFITCAYVARILTRRADWVSELRGRTQLLALDQSIGTAAEKTKSEPLSDWLDTILPALEHRIDSQAAEFDGLSTRSAVVLGFVSILLAGTSGIFQSTEPASGLWHGAVLTTLLMAATLLLVCVLAGRGNLEFSIVKWIRSPGSDASRLKITEANALIQMASANESSLAWVRGFFYSGVAIWALAMLLFALSVWMG